MSALATLWLQSLRGLQLHDQRGSDSLDAANVSNGRV